MSKRDKYFSKAQDDNQLVPFDNAEQAWFWFIQAQEARNQGARFSAGLGTSPRPCEPADVLNILNRLHRSRRLSMEHILVLRHYGKRLMPPDFTRTKEMRAHNFWHEAMDVLSEVFAEKGIIEKKPWFHVDNAEADMRELTE